MDFKALISGLLNRAKSMHGTTFSAVFSNLRALGVPASVALVIGELVTGVVMLFVGLFMLDAVYTATALNASSVFYALSTQLVTTTGTIFSVLGLVIIVVALGTAISTLRNSMA